MTMKIENEMYLTKQLCFSILYVRTYVILYVVLQTNKYPKPTVWKEK